jgi:hypothetical protein
VNGIVYNDLNSEEHSGSVREFVSVFVLTWSCRRYNAFLSLALLNNDVQSALPILIRLGCPQPDLYSELIDVARYRISIVILSRL